MQETVSTKKAYKVYLRNGLCFEPHVAGFCVDNGAITFYRVFRRESGLIWSGVSPEYQFRASDVVMLKREFIETGNEMEFGAEDLFT